MTASVRRNQHLIACVRSFTTTRAQRLHLDESELRNAGEIR